MTNFMHLHSSAEYLSKYFSDTLRQNSVSQVIFHAHLKKAQPYSIMGVSQVQISRHNSLSSRSVILP